MIFKKEFLVIFLLFFLFVFIFNQKIKNFFSFLNEKFFKKLKLAGFFSFEKPEEKKNGTKEKILFNEKPSDDSKEKDKRNKEEKENELLSQERDDGLNESIKVIEEVA